MPDFGNPIHVLWTAPVLFVSLIVTLLLSCMGLDWVLTHVFRLKQRKVETPLPMLVAVIVPQSEDAFIPTWIQLIVSHSSLSPVPAAQARDPVTGKPIFIKALNTNAWCRVGADAWAGEITLCEHDAKDALAVVSLRGKDSIPALKGLAIEVAGSLKASCLWESELDRADD